MNMRPITINLKLKGGKTCSHLRNSEGNTISTFQKIMNNSHNGHQLISRTKANNVIYISTQFCMRR